MRRHLFLLSALFLLLLSIPSPAQAQTAADELIVYSGESADIYILDMVTRQTRQITSGMPIDIHPMLSPDGQTVVFERFMNGASSIYLVDVDGSNLRILADPGEGPAWSPDGSRIAYSAQVDGEDTIFIIDPDGRNRTLLMAEGETGRNPVWSPDGTQIAFTRFLNVFVMDADGTNIRPVYLNDLELASCLAWSPDSRRLAFHNLSSARQIVLVDANGANVQILTDGPEDNCPTWSPDGQQIVFASVRDSSDLRLFMVDVNGENLAPLLDGYGHTPSWWTAQAAAPPAAQRDVSVAQQDDGLLDYGDVVRGEVTSEAGEDWQFFGNAGDFVSISLEGDSLSDPVVRLVGPDGETEWQDDDSGAGMNSLIRTGLPETGIYTITARGFGSHTGTYSLSVTNHTAVGELTYGNPIDRVLPELPVDMWSFRGQAGDRVSIAVVSGNFDTTLELFNAAGNRLMSNDDGGSGTNSRISYYTLAATGEYYVYVSSFDGQTGRYTILVDVAGAPVGELAYNTQASGEIDSLPGDQWVFTGAAGDILAVHADSSAFQPYVEVHSETGRLLYSGVSNTVNWSMPESGTYTIVVRPYDLAFGSYTVSLTLMSTNLRIEQGNTYQGHFVDNRAQRWEVSANANDLAWIFVEAATSMEVEVYGPDGTFLTGRTGYSAGGSRVPCLVLPSSGVYTVGVRSADRVGLSYRLDVRLTDEAPAQISYGQTVRDALGDERGQCLLFAGQADDVISIELTSEDFDTFLELNGPDGSQLTYDDDSAGNLDSRIEDFSLPVDGTYTIVVRPYSLYRNEDEGTYSLSLTGPANSSAGTQTVSPSSNVMTTANAAQVRAQGTLVGHQDQIAAVAFSPEGLLASGAGAHDRNLDNTIRLWDLATGETVDVIQHHEGGITSLAFTSDGMWMVSTGWDEAFIFYDRHTGESTVMSYDPEPQPSEGYFGAAVSPNSALAVYSRGDGVISWRKLDDLDYGSFGGHSDEIYGAAISPDGTLVATASADGTVKLWDYPTFTLLEVLRDHTDDVVQVDFSADGTLLASASWDGTVRIWQTRDGSLLHVLTAHAGAVTDVAFAPRGTLLASSGADGTIYLWDAASGEQLTSLQGHTGAVNSVAFNPDSTVLASGGSDQTVRLWGIAGETGGETAAAGCQIRTLSRVNVRSGPGTGNAIQGILMTGNGATVIGYTSDSTGYGWWQLSDGGWVRDDVVELVGDCPAIPGAG